MGQIREGNETITVNYRTSDKATTEISMLVLIIAGNTYEEDTVGEVEAEAILGPIPICNGYTNLYPRV